MKDIGARRKRGVEGSLFTQPATEQYNMALSSVVCRARRISVSSTVALLHREGIQS